MGKRTRVQFKQTSNMKLILTITPNSVSIGKETLSKDLYEKIALHSKVIDKSQPGKLVLDFDVKKAFILPNKAIFNYWNQIAKQ